MNTVKDTFIIPNEIASGIGTGEYYRIGGIVRIAEGPSKGQIVKHLQSIDTQQSENGNKASQEILELFKDNPGAAIISGIVIGGITIGATLLNHVKKRNKDAIQEFKQYLEWYMVAEKHGLSNQNFANALFEAYTKIKSDKQWDEVCDVLTQDELEALTICICRSCSTDTETINDTVQPEVLPNTVEKTAISALS